MSTAVAPDPVAYDPYAYAIHEDPYPTCARLRAEAPVYRNDEHGFWALSRHADVREGFRDSTVLSSSHGVSLDPAASGPHAHKSMSFLAMDPPRHGRMRGLVSRAFTPRRVLGLEPRIRVLAETAIDAALERGELDFIAELAGTLPMDVISELLGVPLADRAELRRLSDLLVRRDEGVLDVPPAGSRPPSPSPATSARPTPAASQRRAQRWRWPTSTRTAPSRWPHRSTVTVESRSACGSTSPTRPPPRPWPTPRSSVWAASTS